MSHPKIILLTSIPRSGSSLIARMVKESGAFGGIVRPLEKFGYCENDQIKARCVTPYVNRFVYHRRQGDGKPVVRPKHAPVPFRNKADFYQPPYFRDLVLEIFRREGWDGKQTLYFKMPLMVLMSPVWHHAFPEATWIVIRRDPTVVTAELVKKKWIAPLPDEAAGESPYVAMYIRALDALVSHPDIAAKEVSYETLLAGDLSEVTSALEWCGLPVDTELIRSFINPAGGA